MGRIASPTFVGRTAELAALDDALERAIAGQTATVLIAGDPGVGKTRLLHAWNERASDRAARIAMGSCLDLGEGGPAYTAIIESLRELLGQLDADAEAYLIGPDASVLARLVPELGRGPETDGVNDVMSGLAQTRLFERLVDLLKRASASAPVVIELEDIHWADRSTQAFLLYLVELMRSARLLLIGTYRPEAAEADPVFQSTLNQLARRSRVMTVPVPPFDESELREQLTSILGAPPTNALLTAIRERSEGNPLFAEELVAGGNPSAHLPASIAASTASKLKALSPEAGAVLRVASVVGRTASYDLIREVSGLGDDAVVAALREGVHAGLLEPHHVGEVYRFRHALLQDAVYDDTLPGERRRLHGAVALALSEDPDQPPDDPTLAAQLARHWFEAGNPERAFLASLTAAGGAERQSAYAEAAAHFERAIGLWDRVGDIARDLDRSVVLERATWATFLAGDYHRAIALGYAAVEALGAEPDRSRQIRILDVVSWAEGRAGVVDAKALNAAAAINPDGLSANDRMWLESFRALQCMERGDLRGALALAGPVLEEAWASGDVRTRIQATLVYADAISTSDPTHALTLLDDVKRVAAESDNAIFLTDVDVAAGRVMHEARLYDELLERLPPTIELAGRSGLGRWARPELRYLLAHSCYVNGELARAREEVALARLDRPIGRVRALLEIVDALASTDMGAFGDAAESLEASRLPNATSEEELDRGWLATARAQLALAERRFDDVIRIVDATAPRVVGAGVYTPMTDTAWSLAEVGLAAVAEQAEHARAANDAGTLESMPAIVDRMTGWAVIARRQRAAAGLESQLGQDGLDFLIVGHVARIEGRDDAALWLPPAEFFQPRSVWSLTARYRQAEAMLAARVPRDQVAEVMNPAYAVAVEIGARPLADKFEALARRARIELRPPTAAQASGDSEAVADGDEPSPSHIALRNRGLSEREIEVLTLVAAGFSNRQIAERLFISDKTASVHVSHILDKLGVGTRVEAATVGVRLGLPEVV
jgi:DNA-binding CsgD family transcriptional regulator